MLIDSNLYGISQNPDTKDYIIVLPIENCKKCHKDYTDVGNKWCKPCQINNFKENFTSWTSENEKIDNFIQEMQLKINSSLDKVFEWIQYDQFDDIKEVGQGGVATVYSAIWKDGPLDYDKDNEEYTRESNKKVALKLLHNSQNISNGFLNEV